MKKLFSVHFTENDDGTMGVQTEMHAHYAGPDLLRVMVAASQGLLTGLSQLAERLGVDEDKLAYLLEQPIADNAKPREESEVS